MVVRISVCPSWAWATAMSLQHLIKWVAYGYLAECCEVCDSEGNTMSAAEALEKVRQLIDSEECKAAADLADAANNNCNSCGQ